MKQNGTSGKNRMLIAALVFLITGVYSCTVNGESLKDLKIAEGCGQSRETNCELLR